MRISSNLVTFLIIVFFFSICNFCSATEPALKIISISPEATEILYALGLGESIVAVSSFCNWPEEAQSKEKIGSFSSPNIEKIIYLNPDVVITTGLEQIPVVAQLKALNIKTIVCFPKTVDGLFSSILWQSLSGVLAPFKGEVRLEGKNIYKMTLIEIAQQLAFVSSGVEVAFPFSVQDIVLLGRIPHLKRLEGFSKDDINIAKECLQLTDCAQFLNRPIYALSAGERQRVFIAKMLAQRPQLVYLDEPTIHLDIAHQLRILNLLKTLNQQRQLTVVIVLHDLNLASEFSNRLILLNKGEIEKDGRPEDVLSYETIEKVYETLVLVNKNPISGRPHVLLVTNQSKR